MHSFTLWRKLGYNLSIIEYFPFCLCQLYSLRYSIVKGNGKLRPLFGNIVELVTKMKLLFNHQIFTIIKSNNLTCIFVPPAIELTGNTQSYMLIKARPPRQHIQALNSHLEMWDLEISINNYINSTSQSSQPHIIYRQSIAISSTFSWYFQNIISSF